MPVAIGQCSVAIKIGPSVVNLIDSLDVSATPVKAV